MSRCKFTTNCQNFSEMAAPKWRPHCDATCILLKNLASHGGYNFSILTLFAPTILTSTKVILPHRLFCLDKFFEIFLRSVTVNKNLAFAYDLTNGNNHVKYYKICIAAVPYAACLQKQSVYLQISSIHINNNRSGLLKKALSLCCPAAQLRFFSLSQHAGC